MLLLCCHHRSLWFLRLHGQPAHLSLPVTAVLDAAGASASLVTQSILVPIDVVSQRLMVAGRHVPSAQPGAAAAPPTPAQQRPHPAAPAPRAPMAQSCPGPGQVPNPAFASPPGRQFSALSAAAARPNGFTVARSIVQQEGIGGLYRGGALFWGFA